MNSNIFWRMLLRHMLVPPSNNVEQKKKVTFKSYDFLVTLLVSISSIAIIGYLLSIYRYLWQREEFALDYRTSLGRVDGHGLAACSINLDLKRRIRTITISFIRQ